MRVSPSRATGVAVSISVAAALANAAVATADNDINGTYVATSNGQWAQTNDRYQDEPSVVSRWAITTTCNSPYDCTGTVSSDAGWTAEIYTKNGFWYVTRDLPTWERCADGSSGHGKQRYMFSPIGGPDNQVAPLGSTTFAGFDKTIGDSGACGVNRSLVVEMPFKLVKAT